MIEFLTYRNMQHNYALFIQNRTKQETDDAMLRCYGASWEKSKEKLIHWYENEFVRDESGEIIFSAPREVFMTLQGDGTMEVTDCRLSDYRVEREPEYEDDVCVLEKLSHKMTDQNGKTHDLDFTPYVTMTPEDTKAFSEIAIRLGRVPTTKDNNGVNFDSESIAALLTRLEDESGFNRDMAERDQQNHQWDEADVEAYQERWI